MATTSPRPWDSLPMPVALLARRARNARSAPARHEAAYLAWEVSIRLAAAMGSSTGAPVPERPSVGHFVRAARHPGELVLDHTAVLELHAHLSALVHGTRPGPATVDARALIELIPAYRNRVRAHAGVREETAHDEAARLLLAGLGPVWTAGAFLAPDTRLLHVESIRIDGAGRRRARVLLLEGESSNLLDEGIAQPPAEALPGRLFAVRDGRWTPLHPWVLFRNDDLSESVLFFNGISRRAEFLDYLGGALVRGVDLEERFPGTEEALRTLVRPGTRPQPSVPPRDAAQTIAAGVVTMLLADLGRELHMLGHPELMETVARRAGEFAAELATRSADPLLECSAGRALGAALIDQGRLGDAVAVLALAVASGEAALDDSRSGPIAASGAAAAHLDYADALFRDLHRAAPLFESVRRAQDLTDDAVALEPDSRAISMLSARALLVGSRAAQQMGDRTLELAKARAAVRILEDPAVVSGDDPDWTERLSTALATMAGALDWSAEHAEATQALERAEAVQTAAADAHPGHRGAQRDLAGVHLAIAIHRLWASDHEGVIDACRAGWARLDAAASGGPATVREREFRAWLDKHAARSLVAVGKLEEASRLREEAVSIVTGLATLSNRWGSELAWCRMELADTLLRLGRTTDALSVAQEAVAALRDLLEADPDRPFLLRYLARSRNLHALLLGRLRRFEESLAASREAIGICETLVASDPADLFALTGALAGWKLAAQALQALRDVDGALAACGSALAHCEAIESRNADVLHEELGRDSIEQLTVRVLLGAERPEEALSHAEAALQITSGRLAADAGNLLRGAAQFDSLMSVGVSLRACGRLDDALALFEDARAVADDIAARDAANVDWHHRVLMGNEELGATQHAAGQFREAVVSWQRAVEGAGQICDAYPDSPEGQMALAAARRGFADSLEADGRLDEAAEQRAAADTPVRTPPGS